MKDKIIEILKENSFDTWIGSHKDTVISIDDFEDVADIIIEEVKKNTKRAYSEAYEEGFNARNGLGANTSHELPTKKN